MDDGCRVILSDTMYLLMRLSKSTPPQNRQLNLLISDSQPKVEDFAGELKFLN